MAPSFSMKWRKGKGGVEERRSDREKEGGNAGQNRIGSLQQQQHHHHPRQQPSLQQSPLATQREIKKPTTSPAGKARGFGLAVTSSSSSSPLPTQSGPRTIPGPKTGPRGTKTNQTGLGIINGTKPNLNGHSGTGQKFGSIRLPVVSTRSGLGGPRPGSGSGSTSPLLSSRSASRSQSSDSLKSVGLSEKDRVRSQSLTQVARRLPSPTLIHSSSSSSSSLPRSPTINRSYSSNRASQRVSKELTSSSGSRSIPRSPLVKSPQTRPSPAHGGGGGGGGGGGSGGEVKGQSSATTGVMMTPSLLPPSALKKSLLPSPGSASKPSVLSYRLTRPSLIKQPQPLQTSNPGNGGGSHPEVKQGATGRRDSLETPPVTPPTTDDSPGIYVCFFYLL